MKLFPPKPPRPAPALDDASRDAVARWPAGSPERASALAALPRLRAAGAPLGGYLESVHCASGCAVAMGWLAAPPGTIAWLADDSGQIIELDQALYFQRQDITDAVADKGFDGLAQAFLVHVPHSAPGLRYSLHALSPQGGHCLSQDIVATALPQEPRTAFKSLAELYCPMSLQAERALRIELPLLAPLIERQSRARPREPVVEQCCGTVPAAPRVSVIIPMYGRFDLLEPQLLKFSLDPWLREHAELIYVIDDPELLEPMRTQGPGLARLYGQGFVWLWGGCNRGFSGANNLGVTRARAPQLVFLNSDVFPRAPGWLPALLDVLDQHPEVAAVGPRLLHADGSLQHAGMRFQHRDDLGIWVNHHPWRGLAPELDPAQGLTEVPAVTGACLALRRADLDAVGGWDEGYLIGDFEDSDLCLSLRERGGRIAYLPSVSLTHLERQSFRGLGDGSHRTRVVLFNAARHQSRWGQALVNAPAPRPLPESRP